MNDHTNGPDQPMDPKPSGLPRRHFLGSMGATAVLAAGDLTGCIRKPVEHILPYASRPEDLIPGKPMFYATAMNIGGHVQGLLVESHEGRPTKVDGNPSHPSSLGRADVWAQASINELYDPDRITTPWAAGSPTDWAAADAMLAGLHTRLEESKGAGLAILAMSLPSPTYQALIGDLRARFPQATVYRHDATGRDGSRAGLALIGATGHLPTYDFATSGVTLVIDADPLSTEGDAVANAAGYAQNRRQCDTQPKSVGRLYSVEARLTVTGQNADHRLRLRSSQIPGFLNALAHRLVNKGLSLPPGATLAPAPSGFDGERVQAWLNAVADDLLANRGRSIVQVGERQHAHAHALSHLLNVALGNTGRTVHYPVDPDTVDAGDLRALAQSLSDRDVRQLVILGGNPVHTAPGDLELRDRIASVPLSIYLGYRRDETAGVTTWHLPQAHYLEAWGDLQTNSGVASIQQPLIAPLHGRALSEAELVSSLLEGPGKSSHDLVRGHWSGAVGGPSSESRARLRAAEASLAGAAASLADLLTAKPEDEGRGRRKRRRVRGGTDPGGDGGSRGPQDALSQARKATRTAEENVSEAQVNLESDAAQAGLRFEKTWRKGLHDGVISTPVGQAATPVFQWKAVAEGWPAPATGHPFELDFVLSGTLLDGRFSNNGWMQELPDPVSKVAWDNAAMMSRATADNIGVDNERLLRVSTSSDQITIPVRVMIGIAEGTIVLPLGYGSDPLTGGRVGGGVGAQVNSLRSAGSPAIGVPTEVGTVRSTGVTTEVAEHLLSITQRQSSLTIGGKRRPFARVATIDHYQERPRFVMDDELPMYVKKDANGRAVMDREQIRSLWEEPNERGGQQWGMSIDLNSCIGCNACTIACQSENNISVVGKEEVYNGREMHWIRLDQYFDGDDDDPQAIFQPLGCMHCESAPCEQVCPVGATTHSPEGLNDMTYNRCVGTRYCANNCPFKVRRFNFFNYAKRNDEQMGPIARMQRNPDVTVRFRGVIEKCTYCVQRVNQARIEAKRDGDGVIPDGAITPACAQTCPTQAITFGDINDEKSRVSEDKRNPRSYDTLAEMNLYPRTSYLARIRNPNPKLS